MKTLIFALIALLGVTLGAPSAEARDKKHYKSHSKHHDSRHYQSHSYRSPRTYYYSRPRYYSAPRYYTYDRDPYVGDRYYYSRRPTLTFSFGR